MSPWLHIGYLATIALLSLLISFKATSTPAGLASLLLGFAALFGIAMIVGRLFL